MAIEFKPGQSLRVTITKTLTRASARKTVERLFCKDKALVAPLHVRSRNFIPLPKRRGGQIWTKHPNKIHLDLVKGVAANITATAQTIKDLASLEGFVDVKAQ
jgi:hypothetical protein